MKAFFAKWLAAFDSKRFKALSLTYLSSVLVLAFLATSSSFGVTLSEETIIKIVEYLMGGIFGTTGAYVLGQSYSDGKSGGLTSQAANTAFKAGYAEGSQAATASGTNPQ